MKKLLFCLLFISSTAYANAFNYYWDGNPGISTGEEWTKPVRLTPGCLSGAVIDYPYILAWTDNNYGRYCLIKNRDVITCAWYSMTDCTHGASDSYTDADKDENFKYGGKCISRKDAIRFGATDPNKEGN